MNIRISVITCVYNTDPILFKKTILSLYNQTFKDFEVLIINDGSDLYVEENKNIINELNDNRFIWIDKEHAGKSQALNLALKHAKGKYIAINDSDDISFKNRLEYQYEFLENNQEEYDLVSNAMIRYTDNVIFPNNYISKEVEASDVHFMVNHPCYMFNKENVLDKLPFYFCQMYDSMEDAVMNHIMFYYGVKMYFDKTILMEYAQHEQQVHYNNTKGFLKEVTYKLFFKTFNQPVEEYTKTTCLLVIDDKWNDVELEKTLLNIRLTSNNVNICCVFTENAKIKNKNLIYKYTIKHSLEGNYYHCIKNLLKSPIINSQYIMFINTPIRFTSHNWDLELERAINKPYFENCIIEPILFDMEKVDNNNYNNENAKGNKKNILYGERLTCFTKLLTEQTSEIYSKSEYIYEEHTPILSYINVFFTSKNNLTKIFDNNLLSNVHLNGLFNVFVSLLSYYLNDEQYNNIFKKLDLHCSYVNNDFYENRLYNNSYFYDKYVFIKAFLHETQYIELYNIKNELNKIKNILPDIELLNVSLSNFLQNNNNKESWIY